MRRRLQVLPALLVSVPVLFPHSAAFGQQGGEDIRTGALRVYLECAARGCESSHFRTEITYVNWVRDLRDSELHVIMTSQGTGSGDEYILDFLGRGEELGGINDQLTYSHNDTDTDFERQRGLTSVLAVGLARYSVLAGSPGPFTVSSASGELRVPDLPPGLQGDVDDPWDYWVFGVGGDVEFEDEDRDERREYSVNLSANRTTELWKISVSGRGSLSRREGIYSDGTPFQDNREEGSIDGRVFYSLSERWSAGVDAGAGTSTRDNQDMSAQVGAGIEYSFFPYREWTRRRMTLQALVYARYYDYELITQYEKTTETLSEGAMRWGLGFRQPWGNAYLNASAEGFLHNPRKFHRLSFGGRVEVRLFRGLTWNADASVSRIQDQVYLPLEELSDEDVLLGRRQLPTDSRFQVSTGFDFRFGSIFNNVVNNRFGWVGGGRGRS